MDSQDGGGMKHYSPGEIMADRHLNANNLQLSFGVYCQVAENVEPRNSLAPRTRAAISMGNSGNLSGGQMFFALDTGHSITRHQWVLLPMLPAVIACVNLFGKNEPSILTLTDGMAGRLVITHKIMSLVGMMMTLLSNLIWM
jgi:hypothetical protein